MVVLTDMASLILYDYVMHSIMHRAAHVKTQHLAASDEPRFCAQPEASASHRERSERH